MSAPAWALGTFADAAGPFPAVVVDGTAYDLRRIGGPELTVDALLADWEAGEARVAAAVAELTSSAAGAGAAESAVALGAGAPLAALRPLPPHAPAQILCAGANYHRHVQQIVVSTLRNAGDTRPEAELRREADAQAKARASADGPFFFTGLPSALSGAHDDVPLWGPGREHDWELELAVVIGKRAHLVDPADAMDHVAGYTMSNDISLRDVMRRPGFPMTDFLLSKNRPGFFPTGPLLVPRRFVADHRELRLELRVNGETMQDERVSDIIHDIPALISAASHATALSPGDLILTGSPAGNAGHHGNRWLRPGDVMEASITGLGRQRNRCVAPPQG
ncbi:fumarylacetoacetate hydrolase family protein [Leucobacter allii]|uniref:Fumarylacetoacetate hydrolase family protein n=1 Tax=Leucobacter allii TaxID=2932247 RepID=A0ABY4FMD3_9MICO|nr:fumarylacetoacetate hydrolase family protein [Leucobacter allii]UOQ57432.1 fumarylacetoacetate hydrolase family protein [Leucobacter allii]